MRRLLLLVASAALLLAACGGSDDSTNTATAAPTTTAAPATMPSNVRTATNPTFGKILTDTQGMTLYTLRDSKGADVPCTGQCAAVWPPLAGTHYYRFVQDTKPGDAKGDGIESFGGLWKVARPAGAAPSSATTSAPSAGGGYGY